jgi:hypothetical protein
MGELPGGAKPNGRMLTKVGTKRAICLRDRWLQKIEVLHAGIPAYLPTDLLAYRWICLVGCDNRDDPAGDRNGSQAASAQSATTKTSTAAATTAPGITASKATHRHWATTGILAGKRGAVFDQSFDHRVIAMTSQFAVQRWTPRACLGHKAFSRQRLGDRSLVVAHQERTGVNAM